MKQMRVLQIIMAATGTLLMFWWPLSHWFYPVWYHRLLGFENPAQYADNALVKVIGTAGLFPILLLLFVAVNPLRNRDIVLVLIINCVLWGLTFLYLIQQGQFPQMEYLNSSLFFAVTIFLGIFYFRMRTIPIEEQ